MRRAATNSACSLLVYSFNTSCPLSERWSREKSKHVSQAAGDEFNLKPETILNTIYSFESLRNQEFKLDKEKN
jgi:hypothetical protein